MLVLVTNYDRYFFYGVVVTFDAAVTTRGVGACCEFVYIEGKRVHPSYFGVRCKLWLVRLLWWGRHVRRRRYHSGSRRLS